MIAGHVALLGEPWRYTPAQIADLDRFQVWNLYIRPELARARQAAPGADRPPAGPAGDPFEKGLPSRAEFVAAMTRTEGRTAEHWAKVYDEMERHRAAATDGAA